MRIRVAYGKTINMGNYESTRIEVEATDTTRDDESMEDGIDRLFGDLKDKLHSLESEYR